MQLKEEDYENMTQEQKDEQLFELVVASNVWSRKDELDKIYAAIETLLNSGARPQTIKYVDDGQHFTCALIEFSNTKNASLYQKMLDTMPDIIASQSLLDLENTHKQGPLHVAIKFGCFANIKALIAKG